jgi:hypothetical protein
MPQVARDPMSAHLRHGHSRRCIWEDACAARAVSTPGHVEAVPERAQNSDDVQMGGTKQDLRAWLRDPRSIALIAMGIEICIGIAVRGDRHLSRVIIPDVLAVIILLACVAWIRPSWTDSPRGHRPLGWSVLARSWL